MQRSSELDGRLLVHERVPERPQAEALAAGVRTLANMTQAATSCDLRRDGHPYRPDVAGVAVGLNGILAHAVAASNGHPSRVGAQGASTPGLPQKCGSGAVLEYP